MAKLNISELLNGINNIVELANSALSAIRRGQDTADEAVENYDYEAAYAASNSAAEEAAEKLDWIYGQLQELSSDLEDNIQAPALPEATAVAVANELKDRSIAVEEIHDGVEFSVRRANETFEGFVSFEGWFEDANGELQAGGINISVDAPESYFSVADQEEHLPEAATAVDVANKIEEIISSMVKSEAEYSVRRLRFFVEEAKKDKDDQEYWLSCIEDCIIVLNNVQDEDVNSAW